MSATAASLPDGWLVPDWPAPARVHAAFSNRMGGVSPAPYDSMNLGTHVGDDAVAVAANRQRLEQVLGVRPVFMEQVHGMDMLDISPGTPDGACADGCSTAVSGAACTVMVADCLPILLCDMSGVRVAALHAGWRGLLGSRRSGHPGQGPFGVIESALERFWPVENMDTARAAPEVIAWLGPCIGPKAFEVGDEVRQAFVALSADTDACFVPLGGGKWLADLPALARQRLLAAGVTGIYGNDGSTPWCTVSNPSRYFSHRRDRVSGRQAACIWLV
ncbi:MAG: peptidoglycan editing factor PgeF [Rhodoferax sp.]